MIKKLLDGTVEDGSEQLYPYTFPSFIKRVEDSVANSWFAEVIATGNDKLTYESGLTPAERKVFDTQFGALTFFDVNIPSPLALLLHTCTAPEVRQWIIRQLEEERQHQRAYQYCAEVTGIDSDTLYTQHVTVPTLFKKAAIARRYTQDILDYCVGSGSLRKMLNGVFFYSQVYEGIWFSGGFPPLLALGEQGKMLNICKQLTYIWIDEAQHIAGWREWLDLAQAETGVLVHKDDAEAMVAEGVEAEVEYAEAELPAILMYSPRTHGQWIRALGNIRLDGHNLKPIFKDTAQPNWLSRWQMRGEAAFFESHPVEYQANQQLNWD